MDMDDEKEPTAREALRNYVNWMLRLATADEIERISGIEKRKLYWIRNRGLAGRKDIAALHKVAAILNQSTKELGYDS